VLLLQSGKFCVQNKSVEGVVVRPAPFAFTKRKHRESVQHKLQLAVEQRGFLLTHLRSSPRSILYRGTRCTGSIRKSRSSSPWLAGCSSTADTNAWNQYLACGCEGVRVGRRWDRRRRRRRSVSGWKRSQFDQTMKHYSQHLFEPMQGHCLWPHLEPLQLGAAQLVGEARVGVVPVFSIAHMFAQRLGRATRHIRGWIHRYRSL